MESTTKHGPFLWHELLTSDMNAAIDFYKHVIGWNTQEYDFQGNEGPDYTMWMAGEAPVGGGVAQCLDPQGAGFGLHETKK